MYLLSFAAKIGAPLASMVLAASISLAAAPAGSGAPGVDVLVATLNQGTQAELPMRVVSAVRQASPGAQREVAANAVQAAIAINPAAVTAVVSALSHAFPTMAPFVAAAAAKALPKQAVDIAIAASAGPLAEVRDAVTEVAPDQRVKIAAAVGVGLSGAGPEHPSPSPPNSSVSPSASEAQKVRVIAAMLNHGTKGEIPARVVSLVRQSAQGDQRQVAERAVRAAAAANPEGITAVVSALAHAFPNLAPLIARTAAKALPGQAVEIARAAVAGTLADIRDSICEVDPEMCGNVATALGREHPGAGQEPSRAGAAAQSGAGASAAGIGSNFLPPQPYKNVQ